MQEKYNCRAKELPPLPVGIDVVLQGSDKKWSRTDRIVEALPNRQYRVRMFGSGRVTLRNRRFLRKSASPVASLPCPATPLQAGTDSGNPSASAPAVPTHDVSDTPVLPVVTDVPSHEQSSSEAVASVHRALKCLLPFNNPGLKE